MLFVPSEYTPHPLCPDVNEHKVEEISPEIKDIISPKHHLHPTFSLRYAKISGNDISLSRELLSNGLLQLVTNQMITCTSHVSEHQMTCLAHAGVNYRHGRLPQSTETILKHP